MVGQILKEIHDYTRNTGKNPKYVAMSRESALHIKCGVLGYVVTCDHTELNKYEPFKLDGIEVLMVAGKPDDWFAVL